MVEVRLHGDLAKQYGKIWEFDIASPREAFQALEANCKGFFNRIRELDRRGMVFRVRTKDHDYNNQDVSATLGSATRLDIIPVVAGSNAGTRFVYGAVMVAAAVLIDFYSYGTSSAYTQYLYGAGYAMMLGAVVEWLTPVPKKKDNPGGLNSWTLNGPTNTVQQGLPVPVIYGEVLAGGYTISAGVSASQLSANGSTGPDAYIGGETSFQAPYSYTGTATTVTSVFTLTAGSYGMSEPFSYSWSYSGFSGASAVRLIDASKATVRIEVDYVLNDTAVHELTGSASVTIDGISQKTSGSETPDAVSASETATLNIFIQGVMPDPGGE